MFEVFYTMLILFKEIPLIMFPFSIWAIGTCWMMYTMERPFLLCLIWFIPKKYLLNDSALVEDAK